MSNQTTLARVEAVVKALGTEATADALHISRNTLKKYREQNPERAVEESVLALIEKLLPDAEAAARDAVSAKQRELAETASQLGMTADAKVPAA